MKKIIHSALILASAASLTACGGQTQLAGSAYPVGYQQQPGAYAQNPYAQSAYAYQTPQQSLAQQQQALSPAYGQQQAVSAQRTQATSPQATAARPTAQRTTTATRPPATAQTAATRTAGTAKAAPRAAAPKQSADSIAQQLLQQTRQTFSQLQNYSAIADVYEKNEKGVTNLKLAIKYLNPGSNKLEILNHTNGLFKGAKLVYSSGSDQVTGRAGGVASFLKVTTTLEDDRIKSRRGYRLDQVDTSALVQRLVMSAQHPKVLGKTTIGGRPIAILEYTNANTFDQKVNRELLGIDMETSFIRMHEMYEGQELVYSLKVTELTVNGALNAKDLEI